MNDTQSDQIAQEALPIHLHDVGGVPFATPTPKPTLTQNQLKAVQRAWIAVFEGRPGAAELHLRRVERRIWPKGFDPHHEHRVRVSAAALAARQAEPARTYAPEPMIALPERERGLGEDQLKRFDKAKRALNNPMTKPRARDEHAKTLANIETAPKEAGDRAWVQQATAETLTLARGRGEEVETSKAGRVSIRTRDSLLNMINAGKLTLAQAEAARDCRDAYEKRSVSLGALNYGDTGSGAHDNERFVRVRLARARATEMVGYVERAIAMRCASEPAALQMFRAILEHRMTISDFGDAEATRTRHTEALIKALDVAIEAIKLWRRGQPSPHA